MPFFISFIGVKTLRASPQTSTVRGLDDVRGSSRSSFPDRSHQGGSPTGNSEHHRVMAKTLEQALQSRNAQVTEPEAELLFDTLKVTVHGYPFR